jgi:hypothetical protein
VSTPDLAAISRFAAALASASWFAAVGQELTEGEEREARDYLAALGLDQARLAMAPDWRAAEAATRSPAWNPAWWNAEEKERLVLLKRAATRWGEHGLMAALTRVTDEATRLTLGAAAVAATRDGVADAALTRVAAGAATQAAYQAALALAAGALATGTGSDHAFSIKYRLFAGGRWPLGLVGDTFHLF